MFSHIKELFTRPSGYTIAKSVRLRSSASAYFNRTPSVAGNQKTWTQSFWFKRGQLGVQQDLYSPYYGGDGVNEAQMYFKSDDTFAIYDSGAGAGYMYYVTTQVFRDPSAWYHFVIACDTTQATASNRLKIYVNGVQITSFSTSQTQTQNNNTGWNGTSLQRIGCYARSLSSLTDGYFAEFNNIDGQALTPSSFGETDSITGVWKAKKYSGTYGTNGFYLNFSDNSSNTATTIGKDYSGNGNNWTPNNISVTAGATYDSMLDSPTVSATSSNYAVFNSIAKASSQPTFSNGNLDLSASSAWNGAIGTIGITSGKWYWEVVCGNSDSFVGICGDNLVLTTADPQTLTGTILYYGGTGQKRVDGTLSTYGASYTTETIGVALDIDGGIVTFYKSNSSQGSISLSSSTLNGKTIFPFIAKYASTATINFGQRPFSYTPPTGYVALNTYNLPASTITNGAAYMAATTYTGTGATASISNSNNGVSFQPDFVWIKSRSNAYSHKLYDSVRGVYKELNSDSTAAEQTDTNQLTAFNSNGWSVGSGLGTNGSGSTFVGWQWKAGGTSSSNTNGSITSTVSVGATQGFSVVTYTATAATGTIGHGLGVAPSMIITARRSSSGAYWGVYHQSLGASQILYMQVTNAATADLTTWNATSPTSSVFSVGNSAQSNNPASATYVAYCFAAVKGFSAFGSYTGNGSTDGPFVYTGFRPRWIMVKNSSDGTTNWILVDTSTSPYNATAQYLIPNSSSAETSGTLLFDILSNGFKCRLVSTGVNGSGNTMIYAAFAENPFKNALAR